MKVLVWNIRGLNKPLKQQEIKRSIRSKHVAIICLLETRVKEDNVLRIKDYICPSWMMVHNYDSHPLGRIWICWDPVIVSMDIVSSTEQVLTCKVTETKESMSWIMAAAYGANQGLARKQMMGESVHVRASIEYLPWIIAGDFNVIRYPQESSGSHHTGYEKDFVECIKDIEVEDLAFTGCFHTWTNKQEGMAFVSKKLDRVLSNMEWLRSFPNTTVEFLERWVSDHSPALVTIQ
jgi:hypothetical protein